MMTIVKVFLFILGFLFVLGVVAVITVAVLGRKFYLSWKKPYKEAIESFNHLPAPSRSFIEAFVQHRTFGDWFQRRGKYELDTLAIAYCASDERKRVKIMEHLPKHTKRQFHHQLKRTKQLTQEEVIDASRIFKEYMKRELENPHQKVELGLYALYFHEEYGPALHRIQHHSRHLNKNLREKIEQIVEVSLRNIPYYKERRMYEHTHKLETVLTKDLPEMLELMTQFSPSQRAEKEKELEAYLHAFSKELQQSEEKVSADINQQLVIKMRATTEKFKTT
ncbi:DUF3974 domain-containing protein [Priestia taiwanensis]|uniref:DUF3974 domain-containing protein n=1 Tax=Priestia taiwanensis TaxID=1347902 RepID=A0A917ETZ8_9BACI|nr:DUF3974 domain-containing protein [Priestia taiwanensis]MBM7364893.1 hypothetical protein [Priestia taiwanensis]GGE82837.1 hypothetical protein GCM10007140_35480 [Priestia taiwanensis]